MQEGNNVSKLPDGGDMSVKQRSTESNEGKMYEQPVLEHERVREGATLAHILLVEDDRSLAQLEAEVLKAHGYTVVIVESGELAISALHEAAPDLVLLDLDLPGEINGWDVLGALRMEALTSRIPVLLTSAESMVRTKLRHRGESRLTVDHLPKPYPMQTLLKRIARMLTTASRGY